MKYLLIEDDQHKSKQIVSFLMEEIHGLNLILRSSYQSGLKEVITQKFDLILLDMQLPNFDIKPGEDGYKFRKLAGMDILEEIIRKNRNCKVIVITQFETFGEKEKYIDLADLKQILADKFSNIYLDTIFYSPDNTLWQKELLELINDEFYDKNFSG